MLATIQHIHEKIVSDPFKQNINIRELLSRLYLYIYIYISIIILHYGFLPHFSLQESKICAQKIHSSPTCSLSFFLTFSLLCISNMLPSYLCEVFKTRWIHATTRRRSGAKSNSTSVRLSVDPAFLFPRTLCRVSSSVVSHGI